MNYTFSKVTEKFPKKVNRSNRLKKKMFLGEYKEYLFSYVIEAQIVLTEELEDVIIDLFCEHDDACTISYFSNVAKFDVITMISGEQENIETYIKDYLDLLIQRLSSVLKEFKIIESIDIKYGDANYGDWF